MSGKKVVAVCLAGMTAVLAAACSGGRAPGVSAAEQEQVRSSAKNRMEAVEELGTLAIGISADYAPFAFEAPDGEDAFSFEGADVELGRYIAEQMGVEADFHEMEFEDCLKAVEEGTVDLVLLGMLPKAEREAQMDFTDPYYQPGRQVILVKASQKNKLSELSDFEGKAVAAQYGSLQAQLVTEQLPGSRMELTESASGSVLMLRLGTVSGAVLDEGMAEKALKERTDLALCGAELSYEGEALVGGVVKGETELLARVNEILAEAAEENRYLEWLDAANELAMSLQQPIP